jgi:hypothetical protein
MPWHIESPRQHTGVPPHKVVGVLRNDVAFGFVCAHLACRKCQTSACVDVMRLTVCVLIPGRCMVGVCVDMQGATVGLRSYQVWGVSHGESILWPVVCGCVL